MPAVKARNRAIRMSFVFARKSIAAIAARTCGFVRYERVALFVDVCAALPEFGQAFVDFFILMPLPADAFVMVSRCASETTGVDCDVEDVIT